MREVTSSQAAGPLPDSRSPLVGGPWIQAARVHAGCTARAFAAWSVAGAPPGASWGPRTLTGQARMVRGLSGQMPSSLWGAGKKWGLGKGGS